MGEKKGKGSFRGSSLKRPNFWKISKFGVSRILGLKRKEERKKEGREGGMEAASTGFKYSHFLTLVMTRGRH